MSSTLDLDTAFIQQRDSDLKGQANGNLPAATSITRPKAIIEDSPRKKNSKNHLEIVKIENNEGAVIRKARRKKIKGVSFLEIWILIQLQFV